MVSNEKQLITESKRKENAGEDARNQTAWLLLRPRKAITEPALT